MAKEDRGFAALIKTEAGQKSQIALSKKGGDVCRDRGRLYQFSDEERRRGGKGKKSKQDLNPDTAA